MVFSSDEKAVIKNGFIENEWSAYRICKEHPTKNWNRVSVQRLLNAFKKHSSMDRRHGLGIPEQQKIIEDLICSQEDPGTHISLRDRKILWHHSLVREKNGMEKRVETIQVYENATNE